MKLTALQSDRAPTTMASYARAGRDGVRLLELRYPELRCPELCCPEKGRGELS